MTYVVSWRYNNISYFINCKSLTIALDKMIELEKQNQKPTIHIK